MKTRDKIFVVLFVVLIAGCGAPDPSGQEVEQHPTSHTIVDEDLLKPPQFNHGDVVAIKDGLQVGIVVKYQRWELNDMKFTWVYHVMFQNSTIKYSEDNLELVDKFDWNAPAKQGVID